jgi:RimJ/RimL family protein N-acetyltransferase
MGEHETYKFWTIATNDDEKRIVGWVSLSEIDKANRSACFYGLVIGDEEYHDGFAWIESYLFIYEYAFERLGLNRVYGTRLMEHKQTKAMGLIMFSKREGVLRQAVYKNGQYHDLSIGSLLSSEYFEHKNNGDYEISAIIRRIKKARKEMKNNE